MSTRARRAIAAALAATATGAGLVAGQRHHRCPEPRYEPQPLIRVYLRRDDHSVDFHLRESVIKTAAPLIEEPPK